MKEIAQTLREELKRIAASGEEFVSLDDDSVELFKQISAQSAENKVSNSRVAELDESSAASEITRVRVVRVREQPDESELLENVKEIKFIDKIDPASLKIKEDNLEEKKLKISKKVSENQKISSLPKPKSFVLPNGDKLSQWNFLRDLVLSDPVCNAHIKPSKKVVFGVGCLDAKIFFCGEAPGADEEIQGEPFVGRAGQLLTKIIGAMGLSREQVYIGNIMNWRPEIERGNRPPTQEEMEYCLPYLKAQIQIIKPQIVVALGNTAVNGLLGIDPSRRMGKVRGKWSRYGDCDLMITYHPSFLLQYASAAMKRLVWEDMLAVMQRAGIPISEKQRGYYANAAQ